MKKAIVYTDGASRDNPGEAGIGVAIFDEQGKVLKEISRYIGKATNNVAEYKAVLAGLKASLDLGIDYLCLKSDSQLLIRQLTGMYSVKNEGLVPLYSEAMKLLQGFKEYDLEHIPRKENKLADKLANEGIENGIREE